VGRGRGWFRVDYGGCGIFFVFFFSGGREAGPGVTAGLFGVFYYWVEGIVGCDACVVCGSDRPSLFPLFRGLLGVNVGLFSPSIPLEYSEVNLVVSLAAARGCRFRSFMISGAYL